MVGIAAMLIMCRFQVAVENGVEVDQAATSTSSMSTPLAAVPLDQTTTGLNVDQSSAAPAQVV